VEPAAATMLEATALQKNLAPGADVQLVDSSTYNPAWLFAQVLKTDTGQLAVDLDVPVAGQYGLSLGYVANQPTAMMVALGSTSMTTLAQVTTPGQPERTVFPVVSLPAGKTRLTVRGQGSFGIYGVTLQPVYRPVPSPNWLSIGPFPTNWHSGNAGALVKEAMLRVDPPMQGVDVKQQYPGDGNQQVAWQQSKEVHGGVPHFDENAGLSFLYRAKVQERGVCYAATYIVSPDERDAEILIGCDWWANAWLNGQLLKTDRPIKYVEDDGCAFSGWRPLPAKVHLQKGSNILLVKSHGGTVANWFTCYISDPGDLRIAVTP
ncbi:MAG TPA: hypothetical protein VGM23_03080, partial [Armatimonadota bacterium]